MNEHEARLGIVTRISEVLFDLAQDGLEEGDDVDEMRDAMGDAAELVMEALGVEVVSVEGSTALIRVSNIDLDA